jgi:hypothetical protein
MVMGRPRAVPSLLSLPGGHRATIGAWCTPTCTRTRLSRLKADQVAAYTATGTRVTIPSGYAGWVISSSALRGALAGRDGYTNSSGAGTRETVVAFRFADPAATTTQTVSMPIARPSACRTGTCAAGKGVLVPTGGVLLVAAAGQQAANGLSRLASGAAAVTTTVDDARWAAVTDVMGGKPQYVKYGHALAQRPAFVDDWQWSYDHWRPALVQARHGDGWLVICGGSGAVGVTGGTWGRMLVQLGAKNAMGFDNNSSTELFQPGSTPITAYGFERSIPSATALVYS